LTKNLSLRRDWGLLARFPQRSNALPGRAKISYGFLKRVMLERVMLKKICTILFYVLISHMNTKVFMSYNFIGGFIYEND
jgi:hypothetical protein